MANSERDALNIALSGNFTLKVTWTDGTIHEASGLSRRAAEDLMYLINKIHPEDKVEIIDNNQ